MEEEETTVLGLGREMGGGRWCSGRQLEWDHPRQERLAASWVWVAEKQKGDILGYEGGRGKGWDNLDFWW